MNSIDTLVKHKQNIAKMNLIQVIRYFYQEYGNELLITSSLGYSGIVLIDHIKKAIPHHTIYFIDTGFHFQETLNLIRIVRDRLNVNIQIVRTEFSEEELEFRLGEEAYKHNQDLCCHFRKVDPLLKLLKTRKTWMTAIRRDQSESRSNIEMIELDERGTIKINPLYNWDSSKIWEYIKTNNLPYNQLYDKNYRSIGCVHCTSQVKNSENERAGRWRGQKKNECGLHLFNPKDR